MKLPSPLRGWVCELDPIPWARAHGYIPAPLRGESHEPISADESGHRECMLSLAIQTSTRIALAASSITVRRIKLLTRAPVPDSVYACHETLDISGMHFKTCVKVVQ